MSIKAWCCTNCLKENLGPKRCTFCGAASPDTFFEDAVLTVYKSELDALRAEIKRLRAANQSDREVADRLIRMGTDERERLLEENRRLRVVAEAARSIRDGYFGPDEWRQLNAALGVLDVDR